MQQLSRWLVTDDEDGVEAGCEGPEGGGYMWSVVMRLVGGPAKFLETTPETAYGREMNIQLMDNSSGGHSYSPVGFIVSFYCD